MDFRHYFLHFRKMAETFSKTLVSLKGLSNFRRQIGIDEVKEN